MLDAFDYQCHVAAFTARPHEQSDGTAARWMLGPHIPPQQGAHTVRLSASSDSIVLYCLCHRGHVTLLLLLSLFVNIDSNNCLAH